MNDQDDRYVLINAHTRKIASQVNYFGGRWHVIWSSPPDAPNVLSFKSASDIQISLQDEGLEVLIEKED